MEKVFFRRKKRRFPKLILALVPPLLIAALIALNSALRKPLAAEAKLRASDAVQRALITAVERTLDSGAELELLEVSQTGGESFIINADTLRLNRVITAASRNASELLSELGELESSVDLGSASGLVPLSGGGPRLRVRFTPVGAVEAEPVSSLRASGINQSLYTLAVRMTAAARIYVAGREELVTVKTTVPIAETVIVGNTPQVYTNVANEEDMLNLVPTEVP